ncbi:hypothetical protein KFL_004150030 [Klebsormidium nitens]|uniref:Uncharacterized protein n=1 Tax=Klebsormidium nitens TaxID=105231 RepID=A0A1Y1IFM6_KLENI|nr:hypothetical protein KFL_004150030 [Klebsormidium nitens]|eukprot:GAQ88279.1 hypothetical protein KFL_004150030 [Klebsormidium nitens]
MMATSGQILKTEVRRKHANSPPILLDGRRLARSFRLGKRSFLEAKAKLQAALNLENLESSYGEMDERGSPVSEDSGGVVIVDDDVLLRHPDSSAYQLFRVSPVGIVATRMTEA